MSMHSAFHTLVNAPKKAEDWWLSLYSTVQKYGGAEEGGWWYDVTCLETSKHYWSMEEAQQMKKECESLCEEMNASEIQHHGKVCGESLEWLANRGLEPDYLPEPDSALRYTVRVERTRGRDDNSRQERPYYC